MNSEIPSYEMSFPGQVLERGFWLYIWKIAYSGQSYFYVGRTGDSSSANAASPFNRIGQHLNLKENAKGNSMARQLTAVGVDPCESSFRMLAIGPLFEEESDFELHKPKRDHLATLEYEVAAWLRSKGLFVLGTHHRGCEIPPETAPQIIAKLIKFCGLPD